MNRPETHTPDCEEWCNHCAVCGIGVVWGKRCKSHHGIYLEEQE